MRTSLHGVDLAGVFLPHEEDATETTSTNHFEGREIILTNLLQGDEENGKETKREVHSIKNGFVVI